MPIGPADPRYREVVDRQFNRRFRASPDYVQPVFTTDEVVAALDTAQSEGRRVVATSGGHCLEGFVSDPSARVLIDLAPMKRIYFDRARGAIAVEAGATVGETFRALAEQWGLVLPLGEHPAVGIGGHVVGGAFGFLSRELGLAVDYLFAVEVVTIDRDGNPRVVIATRDPSDPNHDLWWAHTGGGGGNFGIVTRYWFRSADAQGEDPAVLLPRAPGSVTTFTLEWRWSDVDRSAFIGLVDGFGAWCEENVAGGTPGATLWAFLELHRLEFGTLLVRGVGTDSQASHPIKLLVAALGRPADVAMVPIPWLEFALDPFPDLFRTPPGGVSVKVKDALLKRRLTPGQLETAHEHLTQSAETVMGGVLGLATYGGAINGVATDATASAGRRAIIDLACTTGWIDPGEESRNLGWVRAFYRDLFAETGGVPVPGDRYDGALINHPDTDFLDPTLNTSSVAWHSLYYQANYPRLQRIKAEWDPRDVFHHALSIRPGR